MWRERAVKIVGRGVGVMLKMCEGIDLYGLKNARLLMSGKCDGLEGYILSLFFYLFGLSIYFFLKRSKILTQVATSKE